MIDKTIISYTREVLRRDSELIDKLGEGFEVFFNSGEKAPPFNYIVTRLKRSKQNDPVQLGFFFVDIYTHGQHQEKLIEAANIIESLLDELIFPGGGAIRLYLRDLDFFRDPEKNTNNASLMFAIRGNNI